MAVYRFRIVLEDNEDTLRDIDIKSVQTFEELHIAIQDAFKFDKKHSASFFVSDDYWRKGLEITFKKEDLPLDPEEIKKNIEPKKLMSAVKIAKYVDHPHQRFVYVFDPAAQWIFLVELLKIVNEEPKVKYPSFTKSVGTAPKQYKQIIVPPTEMTPDALMAEMLKGQHEPEENEIYKSLKTEGIEEEDLVGLDGEEGEEEVTEEEHRTDSEEGGDDFVFGEEGHEED